MSMYVKLVVASGCLLLTAGCGTTVTKTEEPVAVTINVTQGGKPLDQVTLTLQPMEAGMQAAGSVNKGEFKATVVPGVYTYYIDRARSDAVLAKIPESYQMGSKDRQLSITTPGTFEIEIN